MPELRFEEHVYQVDDFDTVLNTLLKNGHAIPNFCRGGICHSCMMKAEEGTPLPFTQIGLKDELVDENYFLTCQCAVYAPMTIRRPDKDKRTRFVAMVREKQPLSDNVVKISLSPEHEFVYQAGQYTTLINVDGVSDDFPIASVHGDGKLMEFHIVDDPQKPLNQYIISELEVGDGLEIQTALGDCYYGEALKTYRLVVIAVDTALASGLSLIKQALQDNHQHPVDLLFVQQQTTDGYFERALECLASDGDQVKHRCIKQDDPGIMASEIDSQLDEWIDANTQVSTLVLVAADAQLTPIIEQLVDDRNLLCRSIGVG